MLLPLLVANDGCEVCGAAVMAVLQRRCWAGGGSGKAVNSGEVTAVVIARICFYLYKFPMSQLRLSDPPKLPHRHSDAEPAAFCCQAISRHLKARGLQQVDGAVPAGG